MVELTGEKPDFATTTPQRKSSPEIPTASKVVSRLINGSMVGVLLAGTTDTYNADRQGMHEFLCKQVGISTERPVQPEVPFVHNGHIGLQPSTYLPGLIDLRYRDATEGGWKNYNVVVPNVIVAPPAGIDNKALDLIDDHDVSAEMYAPIVTVAQGKNERGDTIFEFSYEKMDETRCIDGIVEDGNGAHFKVVGTIPYDKREIEMQLVPEPDSAPIVQASLGNYFGEKENINQIYFPDGTKVDVADLPEPDDGNFELGDFYTSTIPANGEIRLKDRDDATEQYQKLENPGFTTAEEEHEARKTSWRPEHGEEGQAPWFETERVWQDMPQVEGGSPTRSQLPKWTVGIRLYENPPKP